MDEREERLPQWARNIISSLRAANRALEASVPTSDNPAVMIGNFQGKMAGFSDAGWIRLFSNGREVAGLRFDQDEYKILVQAMHPIAVYPEASNSVTIEVEHGLNDI